MNVRQMRKTRAYHRQQAIIDHFIDEGVVMVDAFLVDVVGKPFRHNPRPRYGEAVELHLRTHHSTIRAVLFFLWRNSPNRA